MADDEFAAAVNEYARNANELIELHRNPPKDVPSIDEAVRAHFAKETS